MIESTLLAAWAADALDPARKAEVDVALAESEALRARALAMRASFEPPPAAPTRWRVPPPGLGLPITASPVAVLDLRPTRVRVELPVDRRTVVLLRREAAGWEVAGVLGPVASIDLAVDCEWAVALAEPGWEAGADAERGYQALKGAIAEGRAPVSSIRT